MKFGKRQIISLPQLDDKGNFSQTFIQDNREIKRLNKQMKLDGNQYTNDKSLKLKARIPIVDFIKFQDRFYHDGVLDEKELNKWLDSDEGEHCKVASRSAKFV